MRVRSPQPPLRLLATTLAGTQCEAMFHSPEGFNMATANAQPLVPLALETRTALPTAEAATHLGRAPQTLRLWACNEDGPLRPLRINGRLAWRVSDLRRLLGFEVVQ